MLFLRGRAPRATSKTQTQKRVFKILHCFFPFSYVPCPKSIYVNIPFKYAQFGFILVSDVVLFLLLKSFRIVLNQLLLIPTTWGPPKNTRRPSRSRRMSIHPGIHDLNSPAKVTCRLGSKLPSYHITSMGCCGSPH